MRFPEQPVTLSVEQVRELNARLSIMRHDIKNHLTVFCAALDLIRLQPHNAERMIQTLGEQPRKIDEVISRFSSELEGTLGIER